MRVPSVLSLPYVSMPMHAATMARLTSVQPDFTIVANTLDMRLDNGHPPMSTLRQGNSASPEHLMSGPVVSNYSAVRSEVQLSGTNLLRGTGNPTSQFLTPTVAASTYQDDPVECVTSC